MADQLVQRRELYFASLISLTENFRKCAEMSESFARALKDASDDDIRALSNTHKRKADVALDDDEAPKKRKRNAKPKDPNAPKRPASSYILFQNEIRKQLKDQHPELTNAELLNMISDIWKKMSEDEKATYHKLVEDAKERYSQDKKAYDSRTPEEVAAANAAVAEAAAAKKSKPRKKKAVEATPEQSSRPPPVAAEVSRSTEASSDEESDADDSEDDAHAEKDTDSDASEVEEPVEVKPTKKTKKATNHVAQTHKSKKGSSK
ncbi:hypothetical protein AGABI1DRAFT_116212 [Agaricus bisporus var. burnettii JB137-S8]|uniref:HMG box domain-containing protein n=2 Tax=Agaricus bisporus var. burnettii TaxID=192524 RepID=K5XMD9_AGABU|nr:hypothetical protein AGABI2DRAFT_191645 [Agaricus bisporus var. bisporus H97]XP_007333645.1 uncharacterized protein AGABI1DRAFT_116212 [Agaricus bisporus var. burnettii JB137-S8]EKM75740.1 hypothetical protein AGABI1DRAFT_116212 [Agaricus bisporus var. burnettii JB137-S8]EKV47935.1 hypothetical protein AGABI2DRAFT_191645 [Agaricus bisporus var. bisporus H97]KAF7776417.1 transcriptional regulator family: HMG [Agaricus bisporus var. burnettii]